MKRNEFFPAIFGFFIAVMIAYVSHEWQYPAPIEFYQRQASKTDVTGGEMVTVSWKERRRAVCDSIIYRRLIASDGSTVTFEPERHPEKPADIEVSGSYSFMVPVSLPNGLVTYRVYTEFRCNEIQRMLGGHIFIMPDIVFNYRNPEIEEHAQ